MREILFRGKRLDNGEWVEGDICHHDGVVSYIGQHPADGSMVCYDLDPATVGQFTGLQGKNKRIFEGDIVRIEHDDYSFDGETIEHRVEEGFIDYDGSMTIGLTVGRYSGNPVGSPFFHILALTDQIKDWSIEVIGNIHDNPELLKEGDSGG